MVPHQSDPVRILCQGIATQSRIGKHDEADRLRTVLKTTKLERLITQAVSTAPPLTVEQVEHLRALFPMPTVDEAGAA